MNPNLIAEQPGLGVGWPLTNAGAVAPLVLPGGRVVPLVEADGAIRYSDVGIQNDGSDQTGRLERGFTLARAAGVPFVLPPYALRYSASITASCSIYGSGPASMLVATNAAGVNSVLDFTSVTGISLMNFGVKTLLADGTQTSENEAALRLTDCSDITIFGMRFVKMGGTAILMRRCADGSVFGNDIRDGYKDSVHMTGGVASGDNNLSIYGNRFNNVGDDAIAVVGYDADAYPVGGISISTNVINGTKFARGITVVGGRDVAIIGNKIRNPKTAGIYIAAESGFATRAVTNVVAAKNTLIQCGAASPDHGAIHIASIAGRAVSYVSIDDNTIRESANNGIFVFGVSGTPTESVSITNNRILDNTDPAGKVGTAGALNKGAISATAYVSNLTIDNNRVNECGAGAIFLAATMTGVVNITRNKMSNINKNGAASNDAITVTTANTAGRIFINENSLGTQAYTLEALIECNNPGITTFGKNTAQGVYGIVHGLAYTTIVPGGSPHVYTAASGQPQVVQIAGGTISAIDVSSDGTNYFTTGRTSGIFHLDNGSRIRVTYTVAPTQFVWAAANVG